MLRAFSELFDVNTAKQFKPSSFHNLLFNAASK